jgi:ubiquinone/menaquinone biosynthesis C-methylase UbiE
MKNKEFLHSYFENQALSREKWKRRNRFYHKILEKYFSFIIPAGSRVLELGCGTGDLLNAVKPEYGLGVDFSENILGIAKKKYPELNFVLSDVIDFSNDDEFEYVIISDLLSSLWDIQAFLQNLKRFTSSRTKIIISTYNFVWEPVLRLGEFIGLKKKQPLQSWLTIKDIENLLLLEGFELVKVDRKLLFPKYIPVLNFVFNTLLANFPWIRNIDLVSFLTIRKCDFQKTDFSVSIVIPARNEKGNIENAIIRTPEFGIWQEFIFIEGNSKDNTYDEIIRVQKKYSDKKIVVLKQSEKGKGNAVREAFETASGEILMILDADLTTPPEDMPKFYNALAENRGEFINGCRLVYPMDKQAMRFLNYLGNKFFGWFFSYLLGQRLKDTLCGTKVLFKKDYELIKANRKYFGEFDPFGDFDLIFGASKLNLKIVEVIVRYRDREYGSTQISRFRHGILLFKMCFFAARKIKFI